MRRALTVLPLLVAAAIIAWPRAPLPAPPSTERPVPPLPFPLERLARTNPLPASAALVAEGERVFADQCASCHGASGAGNGPASVTLSPQPADLRRVVPRYSDAYLVARIKDGKKGTAMPSFVASTTEAERWALARFLRTLGR